MKHYPLLRNKNESVFLINCYLDEKELEAGLIYLEQGLAEKEVLLDKKDKPVMGVLIPSEIIDNLKTSTVEINKSFKVYDL